MRPDSLPDTLPQTAAAAVHGYLLAGGLSSRMGTDKALLELAGVSLLDRAIATLGSVCTDVTLVGRAHTRLRSLPDAAPNIGPVGGVAAALRDLQARQGSWALFLPLDVPLLPSGLLRALVTFWLDHPNLRIGFPVADGYPQPAICLVHASARPALNTALETSQHRLRAVLEAAAPPATIARTVVEMRAGTLLADGHPLPWTPSSLDLQLRPFWFSNCNTPEDFARLKEALAHADPAPHLLRSDPQ